MEHFCEFGPFRLDKAERLLLRHGERVTLTPKVFETLVALVEHRGRLIEKDKLMRMVWPDTIVEEANLTNNISILRKTLGERENGESYIETVPRIGYRFTTHVNELRGDDLVFERHSLTRIETEVTDRPDRRVTVSREPVASQTLQEKLSKNRTLFFAATTLFVLIAAGLVAFRSPSSPRDTEKIQAVPVKTPVRSIAVLPFKTMDGEAGTDYLSQGMSEALITKLGNLRQLIVRPTSAIRRYSDTQDAVAAGREQGVDAVLDGSVQRVGDRIRVSVQLLRVADRVVLWSGQFDEQLSDIFALQDSISRQVAQELMVTLSDQEQERLRDGGRKSFEAYESYLKGRYFWNKRTPDGSRKAVEYFNRAIEIDPTYPLAYSGLADAVLLLGGNGGMAPKEAVEKGRNALKRAIAIDDTLAEPHATLGLLAMNFDWNWAEAEREFKRATELNPNYATAHHWYGEFLAYMGRFDEGLAELKRAQEIDPLSLIISTDLGKVHYMARQYDLAIAQCKKTLEMDSNFAMAHVWLGFSYSAKGQHDEAIAEMHKTGDLTNDPVSVAFLGTVYGLAGRKDEAQKALTRLTVLSKQTHVPPICMVLVHMSLGDHNGVFKWYERVFEEHALGVIDLKVSPVLDRLRSDPRYAELLRRANLTS